VANARHAELVAIHSGQEGCCARVVLEPVARNTAAAVAVAALVVLADDPDALLICLPADHHVPDLRSFATDVADALGIAQEGWLVTFGVAAMGPATAFGYIVAGEAIAASPRAKRVARFAEKPDLATAEALIAAGAAWNSGIVLGRADRLLAALAHHAPAVLDGCRAAFAAALPGPEGLRLEEASFAACPSASFDRAVLEREREVAVLPLSGEWADLGSFEAIARYRGRAEGTNRVDGDNVRLTDCDNVIVKADGRPVVAIGVRDLVIVDTPDALLVARRAGPLAPADAEI
jgi:mannose-1-phosphate guanylyltransferase/mannose-6-phosphate isomerase